MHFNTSDLLTCRHVVPAFHYANCSVMWLKTRLHKHKEAQSNSDKGGGTLQTLLEKTELSEGSQQLHHPGAAPTRSLQGKAPAHLTA